MILTEKEARYRFSAMTTVGPRTFSCLMEQYGNASAAWQDVPDCLTENQKGEWKLFHSPEKEETLKRGFEEIMNAKRYRYLIPGDPEYPEQLTLIPDPPAGIFCIGRLRTDLPLAAVIGSRACSDYGRHQALKLSEEAASAGAGIVSGLAAGIDSCGHRGALSAGGYTIAVLGNGIDRCYPAANTGLYCQIAESGAVISEYCPGTPGRPMYFPMRNRLISGLSKVVAVIEARRKSGSLITVERALEQGKDVLALPGRVGDPLSEGCLHLIRQGAGIITCADDILLALGITKEREKRGKKASGDGPHPGLSAEESAVLHLLGTDPVHPDELSHKLGLDPGSLYMILFRLEGAGLIASAGGGMYMRTGG